MYDLVKKWVKNKNHTSELLSLNCVIFETEMIFANWKNVLIKFIYSIVQDWKLYLLKYSLSLSYQSYYILQEEMQMYL